MLYLEVQYISISIHFKREVARWKMRWAIEVQKPSKSVGNIGRVWFFSLFYHWKNVADLTNDASIHRCVWNERLSSIGILHIHRSKRVNIDGIIDEFAGAANRRLAFVYSDDS
jgi:hypothetical protein